MRSVKATEVVLGRSVLTGRMTSDELRAIRRGFASRLRTAFEGSSNADIARRLKTSDAAVKNYMDGDRLPIAEMLLEIASATGINLHWLLTGNGPRRVEKIRPIFTNEEEELIEALARRAGQSFDEQVGLLAASAAELIAKF